MKRAIIVHGWGGSPKGGWIPWLKKELESHNFLVEAPQMPHTDNPTIEEWVPHLAKFVDEEDDNYLIGHSIGCQTILRYLQDKPAGKIKGVAFVAGWLTLSEQVTRNPEEREIAEAWVGTPIDLTKVKSNAEKFVSIFSDDDPLVPEDNWKNFEKLGKIIVLHEKGHIESIDPTILNEVLSLVQ